MKPIHLALLPALVFCLLNRSAPLARASPLVYVFSATLDPTTTSGTPNSGSISERLTTDAVTTLAGTFAYDPATPAQSVSLFTVFYPTGTLRFDQFDDTPLFDSPFTVFNDAGNPDTDRLSYSVTRAFSQSIALDLRDADATVFDTTDMPTAIDLAEFETALIELLSFEDVNGFPYVNSTRTYTLTAFALVPEPTSLSVLALGGAGLHQLPSAREQKVRSTALSGLVDAAGPGRAVHHTAATKRMSKHKGSMENQ